MLSNDEHALAELRQGIEDHTAKAERLREFAADHERQVRALRVKLAAKEAEVERARLVIQEPEPEPAPEPAPTPTEPEAIEVRLRDFAARTPTFTETEAAAALSVGKAQVRRLLDGYVADGRMACSRRARLSIYAWLAPDGDSSPRPRRETPENAARQERKNGVAVAGTGRTKLSGRKDVDRLARAAAKGGATVTKQGNDHIRMEKNGEAVRMSSTPRGSGMSKTKKELRDLGIDV